VSVTDAFAWLPTILAPTPGLHLGCSEKGVSTGGQADIPAPEPDITEPLDANTPNPEDAKEPQDTSVPEDTDPALNCDDTIKPTG
jgi:hypothetical protein